MSDASAYAERLKEVRRHLTEAAAPPAGGGEDEYRAFASGRVGNRPQVAVTFRTRAGRGKTIAYAHLYAVDDDNPNLGCVAEFTRHRVVVRGRNLAELVRLLGDHKVREVRETDGSTPWPWPRTPRW